MASQPAPPTGLGARGRRLWREMQRRASFEAEEAVVLLAACRVTDTLDRLSAELERDGRLTVTNARGDVSVHPLIAEMRQQSGTLERLLRRLEIPEEAPAARPFPPRRRNKAS